MEPGPVADKVGHQYELLKGFVIHEHQHVVLLVEKLIVLLLKADSFNRFGGTETFVQFGV